MCDIYRGAVALRHVIKTFPRKATEWPPSPEDFTVDSMREQIPVLLFNFLAWACGLSDEDDLTIEPVVVDRSLEWKMCSLAQDIVHLSTRTVLPKQLMLSVAAYHITGQKRLVNILNGLGHGASYPSVMEFNTFVAQDSSDSACGIPHQFGKSVPTTVVWDNNDFNEETSNGAGTTHCTTGIIIQRSQAALENLSTQWAEKTTKKKKTMTFKRKFEAPEQHIPSYEKKRKQDIHFEGSAGNSKPLEKSLSAASLSLDLLFYKCRSVAFSIHCEQKSVPGWTDFNKQINLPSSEKSVSKVGYLPVVNANPTEMSPVNAILHQSVAIADELELASMVLVMDQALYAKAQQIRWADENLKQHLVLRMGFHTSMFFLAVIGKCYKESGLEDLMIESGLVAPGSINGVISGHHYNRSVTAHKVIAEAFSHLVWEEFWIPSSIGPKPSSMLHQQIV